MSENKKAQYKVGEQVTISRGKQTGQTGQVLGVDESRETYAVETPDGLKVVSFAGVKAKTEPVLTLSQYQELRERAGSDIEDFLGYLVEHFGVTPDNQTPAL
jgi:transcription antitermination factor NusG